MSRFTALLASLLVVAALTSAAPQAAQAGRPAEQTSKRTTGPLCC